MARYGSEMAVVVSIDAGTTGVRAFAVGHDGAPRVSAYREFPQYFPRPGWVEHDPDEIWRAVVATLVEVGSALEEPVVALGITDQRETIVAWDARSGDPLHRAIVWQDRRTADVCERLEAEGHLDSVRSTTGLVLDPYFSGTKMAWLLGPGGVRPGPDLRLGTIDSWLIHRLTSGAVHATDTTNASRTMLFDIESLEWSPQMCDLLGVPVDSLPEVRPSSGRFGLTTDACPLGAGIPISGVAGDQQAALFGQACLSPGMTKNTYGTGSFVLMNVGDRCPEPVEGLLTTVAWTLADGTTTYALEGAIFVTGAAIQWLRDGLGVITDAAETGPLAESVPDTGGVYFVPALTGLGSPWWDPYARGTVLGITRGTGRAHLARATVESMAYQTRDVVTAMEQAGGVEVASLRVDGGASVMNLLLQFQADQLGVAVSRPRFTDTTAMGSAFLAGLAEGFWGSLDDVAGAWQLDATFTPAMDRGLADLGYQGWSRAVERSRDWARPVD